tara:strand:- start:119 stop:286 length:168 start_codon:yes stop_codon:yes gene_type:complete
MLMAASSREGALLLEGLLPLEDDEDDDISSPEEEEGHSIICKDSNRYRCECSSDN